MIELEEIKAYYKAKIPEYEYLRAFNARYNNGRVCHDMNTILCIMKGQECLDEKLDAPLIRSSYNHLKELEYKIGLDYAERKTE